MIKTAVDSDAVEERCFLINKSWLSDYKQIQTVDKSWLSNYEQNQTVMIDNLSYLLLDIPSSTHVLALHSSNERPDCDGTKLLNEYIVYRDYDQSFSYYTNDTCSVSLPITRDEDEKKRILLVNDNKEIRRGRAYEIRANVPSHVDYQHGEEVVVKIARASSNGNGRHVVELCKEVGVVNHIFAHGGDNQDDAFDLSKRFIDFTSFTCCGSSFVAVSKYYPLGSLNKYLRNKILPEAQACIVMKQLLECLSLLFNQFGLSHRDISMENIRVMKIFLFRFVYLTLGWLHTSA